MTEREKIVAYLRYLASQWPSPKFCERMIERGLLITPEIKTLGRAMLEASAAQIERGQHIEWEASQ